MPPAISVVVPAYNVEKYVAQCLDSIINQTFSDLQIICVDDGSTDHTLAILEEYAKKDDRIEVYSQSNMGPGVARNKGMEYARGKYIIFIDSDDYLNHQMFEHMYLISERNDADITICKAYELLGDKTSLMEWSVKYQYAPELEVFSAADVKDHIIQLSEGWAWDKLILLSHLKNNNIHFPNLSNSEDMMLVFPAIILAQRICIVYEKMVYHRVNISTSVSSRRLKAPFCFIESCVLLKKFLEKNDLYKGNIKKSYINWTLEYSFWNMDTLPIRIQFKIYNKLRMCGLERMGISSEYGEKNFQDKNNYARLIKLEKQSGISYYAERFFTSVSEEGVVKTFKKLISSKVYW
ncbi:glycosyltransferase family 2 protein [Methanomethylophilus alvi]|uniref:glycosyltransferase family 2 protein n=1 Tax=Methanomethylophilus alvi TaxID=1291540 RepID=UPI0037DBF17D